MIFKTCVNRNCLYDTQDHPGLSIAVGRPSYECPSCRKHSFVPVCSLCKFQYNQDCPLTLLLSGNSQSDGSTAKRKTGSKRRDTQSSKMPDLEAIAERTKPIVDKEGQQAPSIRETAHDILAESPFHVRTCNQCGQVRCQTCKPGYNNLIVDMKDFSKTFGNGIRLCTMCQHWLCPGSELVVIFRCRVCGHHGCEGCLEDGGFEEKETEEENGPEQWYICCNCMERSKAEELKTKNEKGLPIIADPD